MQRVRRSYVVVCIIIIHVRPSALHRHGVPLNSGTPFMPYQLPPSFSLRARLAKMESSSGAHEHGRRLLRVFAFMFAAIGTLPGK